MDNYTIAQRLTAYAHHLEESAPSLYRSRAYRRAASTLLGLDRPAAEIVAAEGRKGLQALPGIGAHLAYTIEELVRTGEFRTFDQRNQPASGRRAG
jgi:DNA polymerase/3'-5' exonuclease PolX